MEATEIMGMFLTKAMKTRNRGTAVTPIRKRRNAERYGTLHDVKPLDFTKRYAKGEISREEFEG